MLQEPYIPAEGGAYEEPYVPEIIIYCYIFQQYKQELICPLIYPIF